MTKSTESKAPMPRRTLCGALMATVAAGALALGAPGAAQADTVVRVGFPNQTEQAMLGYMAALILERQLGFTVELAPNLGGTAIGQRAIIEGAIDVFPDYTGDALANQLQEDPITDPMEAFERVATQYDERFDITWLAPTAFNNTYALAVKRDKAEELGLATISDMEPHAGDWRLGSSVEFAGRPIDGYPGMIAHYGFDFGAIRPMDIGLMYSSIDAGEVDVIVAFATDARIELVELQVLEDDKYFFPAYNAAITVRNELLDRHPEIREAIDAVIATLDTDTQISLNARADIEQVPIDRVAEEYLRSIGAID